jgi:DNA topoisomerase I
VKPGTEARAAKAAGLSYIDSNGPGFSRKGHQSPRYLDEKGRVLRDVSHLNRIRSLAIPPAWKEVWISPRPNTHLQATGRDARRRKQYRYHPDWRQAREETKYEDLVAFGRALPKIRERVNRDLRRRGLPREKVLAAVVQLLETTFVRIGHDAYARTNQSYGLTTLCHKHTTVRGSRIKFCFKGKSGKSHVIETENRAVAQIVRACLQLRGRELFAYRTPSGRQVDVTAEEVNAYLRDISGKPFTAKTFRTWAGTVLAARALQRLNLTKAPTKRQMVQVVEAVAQMLGNTPAVCRRSYIHPSIWKIQWQRPAFHPRPGSSRKGSTVLPLEEQAVLHFLRHNKIVAAKRRKKTKA